MTKYNITEKKEKEAAYRSLVSPKLMDELEENINNIIIIQKSIRTKTTLPSNSLKTLVPTHATSQRSWTCVFTWTTPPMSISTASRKPCRFWSTVAIKTWIWRKSQTWLASPTASRSMPRSLKSMASHRVSIRSSIWLLIPHCSTDPKSVDASPDQRTKLKRCSRSWQGGIIVWITKYYHCRRWIILEWFTCRDRFILP